MIVAAAAGGDGNAMMGSGSLISMVLWMVVLFGFMYFIMIRPQRKQQKEKDAMIKGLEVGDTVLTTSGFYGTVIDISDDMVIVEFGNNRNCRIPMQRAAITAVEKPEDALKEAPAEPEKPKLFGFGKKKAESADKDNEKKAESADKEIEKKDDKK